MIKGRYGKTIYGTLSFLGEGLLSLIVHVFFVTLIAVAFTTLSVSIFSWILSNLTLNLGQIFVGVGNVKEIGLWDALQNYGLHSVTLRLSVLIGTIWTFMGG